MSRLTDRLRAFHMSYWAPTVRTMHRWALVAVIANAGITVTGATVRVTKSGLGCPTWPTCTPDSLIPVAHPEHSPINMAIEFGNRMLTFAVLFTALACLLAAIRLPQRRTSLVVLAWLQPVGVAFQALWGGLVVRTMLNPVTVSVHFVASIALVAACWALYARAGEGDGPAKPLVAPAARVIGSLLIVAVLTVVLAGVVTTGTGPHSGDVAASRFDFDLETVARIHGTSVYAVVALTAGLWLVLRATGAPARAVRASAVLFGVVLAQGAVGYLSWFLAIPAYLVALHVLGATLVWIATLNAFTSLRVRGPLATAPTDVLVATSRGS
ncbi:cytochrome b561 [Sinosporangium siamense]|uniref:Cytochrome b561 n=1 Tax=Sinosporangium siamense TaxID=1367973 RepID=A0A919RQZ5_9ACTN|nr:cytochrome b561 [Sinosporangium siamense]